MGPLPFGDRSINYTLPFKRDEVLRKFTEVANTQNTVNSRTTAFNHQLDQYKFLIVNNALLIYIDKTVRMQDLELKNFTAQIGALPPPLKNDSILYKVTSAVELIGNLSILKFVVNLGELVKNAAVWPDSEVSKKIVEDLAKSAFEAGLVDATDSAATESLENVTGEVTEEVIQASSSATLAATGTGIFFAVGMDVIYRAFNDAKSVEEVDKLLNELDKKMTIVNGYLKTVDARSGELTTKSVDQIGTFKKVVAAMKDLLPPDNAPTFDTSFPDSADLLDKCLAAQQTAIEQFGILSRLRTTYISALDRNHNHSKAGVVDVVLLTSPVWATEQTLNDFWNVVAKYSTLMKDAK